ncbi:hypothetical protein [Labedella endophytica]|uniref:Uncharacterized protein n=1 Tax=Labedella endophytica TaxID=1523160 RepID=A0A3S0VH68_9MICO|nr:hypothetical protein [Labedella endophytica]RUR01824.1 hypothetical protein ELQ94_10260 [Labedella endophytica]
MSTPLNELFPEEQAVDAPTKPRGALMKLAFTLVLLIAGSILFVLVGSSAVVGAANAFGIALDSRYCSLETALDCTSVSVGEIDRATGVDLPEDAVVAESSWHRIGEAGRLEALVEAPGDGWSPPASAFEQCGAVAPCTGETPALFEANGIEVTAELVPRLNLGDGSERSVFLGRDDSGQDWVFVGFVSAPSAG